MYHLQAWKVYDTQHVFCGVVDHDVLACVAKQRVRRRQLRGMSVTPGSDGNQRFERTVSLFAGSQASLPSPFLLSLKTNRCLPGVLYRSVLPSGEYVVVRGLVYLSDTCCTYRLSGKRIRFSIKLDI